MTTDEYPADTDAALLTRFASSGDGRAFATLVERYGGMVLGVCRRTSGHEQDAEDAFQATFLVLARKATAIRRRESIGPWLYGVATRVGRKAREVSSRRQSRETTLGDALPAGLLTDEADELRPILDEAISRLPARFLRPIVLCYFQGQSTEAAARTLGCPKGTVLSRLARARDRLRSQLIRRGVTLSAAAVTAVLTAQATAAVPLPLAYSTIQSATPAAAGTVSAQAAALAKGVLTAMWVAKVVRLAAVTAAVVLAGAGLIATQAWADKPPATEAKSDKLEGTWQVTTFIKDGNEGPKEDAEATKLVLSGESFTLIHREEKVTGKFKADPSQKPATFDIEVTEGDKAGESQMGIYELNGDTLTICTAHKGSPRPTKFESTAGSSQNLVTLKRVKE
jgi:RNA polymerase sigma factor (sigma-70 family)